MKFLVKFLVMVMLSLLAGQAGAQVPAADSRALLRGTDTPWPVPQFASRAEWEARAAELRRRVLFSAGLLPLPGRTPLHPQIFGRTVREGYSVEKVSFESLPGFFVTGNLYRPVNRAGPFPGVLSPHGHWTYGRLQHDELASVPGRAINLARQGYVVFSFDMIGYNDSYQVDHNFHSAQAELWSFNVLGLQLWNSIRALDFLESLPEVDPKRLAVTGASGGGTQTFLLAAVDDRVRVSAPVNMVSAHFQGGDNCENVAGLRLDQSNVEIAALAAPRPMLLVSATGDWTLNVPRIEFPAIQHIYRLLGADAAVAVASFDAEHNYNRESREAVYAWFARWLSPPHTEGGPVDTTEQRFRVEPLTDVLVWYGRMRPEGADVDSLLRLWQALPVDSSALRYALAAEWPERVFSSVLDDRIYLSRGTDRVELRRWPPEQPPAATVQTPVLLVGDSPPSLVHALQRDRRAVFHVLPFEETRDTTMPFFTTYNRTADQIRVQDVLTAAAYLQGEFGAVDLVGAGRGGLWALLARGVWPGFRRTVADADRFDVEDDSAYLHRLFIPGLRRAGDFRGLPSGTVRVHNTGGVFRTSGQLTYELLSPDAIAKWLSSEEAPDRSID